MNPPALGDLHARQKGASRAGRLLILLAGIAIGQAILYWPSFIGRKILLPLDILALPLYYLPADSKLAHGPPHNMTLSDLVVHVEPSRRYLGAELRSGRFPLWNPYQFAGVPDLLPKFSPFVLLSAAVESPRIIPWIELLKALAGGLGFYCFSRRVLRLAFWPATFAAWCYPLTGFFVLWQGYGAATVILWMPWLLLGVNGTIRQTSPQAPLGVAAVTGLLLTSGALDMAGQVLLASGLYGVWCWFDAWHNRWLSRSAAKAVTLLALGWALGFALAAPYLAPTLEYSRTGIRMVRRSSGREERPPVGLAALPQTILPVMYGSRERGSFALFPEGQGNLAESTAAGYTGLLATLFAAPLAWYSRRHRSITLFWLVLAFIGLSWSLNVPGLVFLLRLPGLNLMSHNRFVFAASFAILALAAIGLEALWKGPIVWRRWFWAPCALLAGLCAWFIERALFFPEEIGALVAMRNVSDVSQVCTWFAHAYSAEAILCGLGLVAWLSLKSRIASRSQLRPLMGVLMAADLLWFGYGRAAQCDPDLYYPKLPVLEQLAASSPGRIIGFNCLPPLLPVMCGLHDLRGYDAVDPARLIYLLESAIEPQSTAYPYALTQWVSPRCALTPEGNVEISPILSMFNVRHVIFRGSPLAGAHPVLREPDYWVLENPAALPRPFVPRRIETVADDSERLSKLAARDFDPGAVAYVECPISLPNPCAGTAEILGETPTRIRVATHMETPGMVVLADRWDKGWHAYFNGQEVPILRTNHAVRGVVVPAGNGTLEFRYWPASFAWGLRVSGLAAIVLLVWGCIGQKRRRGWSA